MTAPHIHLPAKTGQTECIGNVEWLLHVSACVSARKNSSGFSAIFSIELINLLGLAGRLELDLLIFLRCDWNAVHTHTHDSAHRVRTQAKIFILCLSHSRWRRILRAMKMCQCCLVGANKHRDEMLLFRERQFVAGAAVYAWHVPSQSVCVCVCVSESE